MKGKVYISAKEELKQKIKKSLPKTFQIIYTDNLKNADYVLIERQPDGDFLNEQFAALVIATERNLPVLYIKESLSELKERQIKETRKALDMEIE